MDNITVELGQAYKQRLHFRHPLQKNWIDKSINQSKHLGCSTYTERFLHLLIPERKGL